MKPVLMGVGLGLLSLHAVHVAQMLIALLGKSAWMCLSGFLMSTISINVPPVLQTPDALLLVRSVVVVRIRCVDLRMMQPVYTRMNAREAVVLQTSHIVGGMEKVVLGESALNAHHTATAPAQHRIVLTIEHAGNAHHTATALVQHRIAQYMRIPESTNVESAVRTATAPAQRRIAEFAMVKRNVLRIHSGVSIKQKTTNDSLVVLRKFSYSYVLLSHSCAQR